MIEETVQLAEIESEKTVWVRTQRQSTCGKCAAQAGCGTKVLSDYVGGKLLDIRALLADGVSIDSLAVGDHLVVGIPEQKMLTGSLISYGLPLFGLFAFAIPAALFGAPDLTVAFLGLAGLSLGLLGLRQFAKKIQPLAEWQPVVLRKVLPEQPLKFVPKPDGNS